MPLRTLSPRPRRVVAAATATVLAAALAGCGSDEQATASQSGSEAGNGSTTTVCEGTVVSESDGSRVVDTAFGEVTIPADPERVVGLEGGTGPVLESGITPVATADDFAESYLPDEYDDVEELPLVLTPDGWDYEKLAGLKPDLMVGFVRGGTEDELSDEKVQEWERLNAIAPTALFRSNGSGQTKDVSCAIQVALGHQDEADAAKRAYEQRAEELREEYADVLAENTVVALDAYEDVSVFSPLSWIGDVLTDAGATLHPLAAGEDGENAVFLSFEELGQLADADVVLYSETVDGEPDLGAVDLQSAATYDELPAVKAGHAYGVRYFFADRYSTALIALDSLEPVLQQLQSQK